MNQKSFVNVVLIVLVVVAVGALGYFILAKKLNSPTASGPQSAPTISVKQPKESQYTSNPTYPVFIAEFAVLELQTKRAAIIGQAESSLKKRFEELGGTVVFTKEEVPKEWIVNQVFDSTRQEKVFEDLAALIISNNPDMVFFGTIMDEKFDIVERLILVSKLKRSNFIGEILFIDFGNVLDKYCPDALVGTTGSDVNGILYVDKARSPEKIARYPWLENEKFSKETIHATGYIVLEWKYDRDIPNYHCHSFRYEP